MWLTCTSWTGVASPETLKAAGLIRSLRRPVKILGNGEVTSAHECSVHAVSASARKKVEAAGGSVAIISPRRVSSPRG